MVTAFRLHAGLQTRFHTFDTGFICALAIRYYISSPILDVDIQRRFIFVTWSTWNLQCTVLFKGLVKGVKRLVDVLHNGGFVHGYIRGINMMVHRG
jgi:tRNA A-37 threonylcarbamoyl transferase component Bud32